jgi:hypothetical protein
MQRRKFLKLLLLALASMGTLTAANCEKGEWDSSRGAFVFRSKEGGRN